MMKNNQLPPLIDSHCHLNMLDLNAFNGDLDEAMQAARAVGVKHFLCVCVELEDYPVLIDLAKRYQDISISVGIHPNTVLEQELSLTTLFNMATSSSCIAIGETGLDYYRTETEQARENQRQRFRNHIQIALQTNKPLIIHTRQAAEDTLIILEKEGAEKVGGVMHCFSEDWEIAQRALDLNFYISFSGILTFKNATVLQDVAKKAPLDRVLIETDAPFLAPVPFRGKPNHPALVKYVAEALAQLKNIPYEEVAQKTTENFYRCFRVVS